jgi:hypothetical protein
LSCPTRGIHEQMHYYFSKWSITFSTHMLLMSMSFLIPSAKNIFACIWSHMHCVLAHFCIWKLPVFKQSVRVVMRWSCCMRSSTIMMQENNFFSILYISAQITWFRDHSGYGMRWSKADVQLLVISVTVIFLTFWTRILPKTHSILSTIHKLDSLNGYIFDACSVTLRILYQLLHLTSRDLGLCAVIIFCRSVRIVPLDHKN